MPARPVRSCLDCGKLSREGARCDGCRRAKVRQRSVARGTRSSQGYTNDWLRLRDLILQRDGWTCHYCGDRATTADHLIPKARGGLSVPENLTACCVPCNSAKRDRTHDEFVADGGRGGTRYN